MDMTRVQGWPSLLCQILTNVDFGRESRPEVSANELHSGAFTFWTIVGSPVLFSTVLKEEIEDTDLTDSTLFLTFLSALI